MYICAIILCFRAYFVWERDIPVNLNQEQQMRANLEEYKNKLKIGDVHVIPDSFTIADS